MSVYEKQKFLNSFPGCVFRYIDQTGTGRSPVSSNECRDDLNEDGYEAYFTVNGFLDAPNAKKEHCTSINAFFVDIDGRKNPEEIETIMERLMPSYILETKNGYHLYWLLDEPIFKNEIQPQEWDTMVLQWEYIEQVIVTTLDADPVVKDITRIMRQPNTYYWKKSGDIYKNGITHAPFIIKEIHKNLSACYTMEQIANAFPSDMVQAPVFPLTIEGEKMQAFADIERNNFFAMVNKAYPIEERPSFQKLISGEKDTLPPTVVSRNMALLVTATLMRQAGWPKQKALDHIISVGWHGIEIEANGMQEISNTINSAYRGNYTYSYKNDIIAFNMTSEEQMQIQNVYANVAKARKESDKVRFANYEYEVKSKYPYLKKNEAGIIFNYHNGVYKLITDQEISNIILNMLYDDMLWGYRTKHNISDKITCLISIIPDLVITNDRGDWFNVRNGLLQLSTGELKPHTPDFVSLIQSPVVYDPKATAPVWDACLNAWMQGEESDTKTIILQQFAGYLLTSSVEFAKVLFLIGDGGNGKSTFADTLSMVIGSQGTSHIDLEDLYLSFGLQGLIGKRLNVIEEVNGNYYHSHKLKKLVSGETLTINMKFKNQFQFNPEVKFIFAVNSMPRVDDSSTATERRICAVQFHNNFRDQPDTDLRFANGKLASELPGILNWMFEGYKLLMKERQFIVTDEQRNTLIEYRAENSSVDGFVEEALEYDKSFIETATKMYNSYKEFCHQDGRKYKSRIAFTKELKAHGRRFKKFHYIPRTNGHSGGFFKGVKIAEKWDDDSFNDISPRYDINHSYYEL